MPEKEEIQYNDIVEPDLLKIYAAKCKLKFEFEINPEKPFCSSNEKIDQYLARCSEGSQLLFFKRKKTQAKLVEDRDNCIGCINCKVRGKI